MKTMAMLTLAAATAVVLSACGSGTKLLKEPSTAAPAMLGTARDDALEVRIDGLVVRNGPGSWVRHAYWDEYRVTLVNRGPEPVTIDDVAIIDSFGVGAAATAERKALAKQTKHSIERHRKAGMDVAPGAASGSTLLIVGGSAAAVTGGAAYSAATITASVGGSGAGGAAAAGAGIALGGIVIAGYGINRMVQNHRISDALEERAFDLGELAPGQRRSGSAFVPIVPAPTELVVLYRDAEGRVHDVTVPLPAGLSELHLKQKPVTVAEATL
jgi:hypothetical protein